jgi:hypothetical protein
VQVQAVKVEARQQDVEVMWGEMEMGGSGGGWRKERRCGDMALVRLDEIISAWYAAICSV